MKLIELTRSDEVKILLNPSKIVAVVPGGTAREAPVVIVSTVSGDKILVREDMDTIAHLVQQAG